ncbi:Protein of unknown function [Cnuella takakiae]|uniref:DUF3347 domain-containing protein n=1 Tax=Cnuella takakiae TaxID=1302690 RepID=A0A1M4SLB3_9BACT|nr:DUF3347 domain-containing protein [Cnuella takakiae]OLY94538.1 hypothetical protein BUE76_23695 [Cnuella takakiae]SHE33064.1 Protein of unknown function [Cnuella takakiae]
MTIRVFSALMATAAILFTSCGNQAGSENQNGSVTQQETSATGAEAGNAASNQANASANEVSMVIDHYLHVKNALASDNAAEAASGAKALTESLGQVDRSKFTADQQKTFNDVFEDLKEHAEHTAANAGKIDHQREHFVGMSEDVAELVKTFGSNKTLYLDHCPMADNNKGANWISEKKEIVNPYMGKKMPECGKVEQVLTNQ